MTFGFPSGDADTAEVSRLFRDRDRLAFFSGVMGVSHVTSTDRHVVISQNQVSGKESADTVEGKVLHFLHRSHCTHSFCRFLFDVDDEVRFFGVVDLFRPVDAFAVVSFVSSFLILFSDVVAGVVVVGVAIVETTGVFFVFFEEGVSARRTVATASAVVFGIPGYAIVVCWGIHPAAAGNAGK